MVHLMSDMNGGGWLYSLGERIVVGIARVFGKLRLTVGSAKCMLLFICNSLGHSLKLIVYLPQQFLPVETAILLAEPELLPDSLQRQVCL